jgi:hypothetical protein
VPGLRRLDPWKVRRRSGPGTSSPTGLRDGINSASLRFLAVDQLEAQGHGKYQQRFKTRSGRGSLTTGCQVCPDLPARGCSERGRRLDT